MVGFYGLIFFLAKHQDEQERARSEAISDIEQYSKAFLAECQRIVGQVGFGAPHVALKDFECNGYLIPKKVRLFLVKHFKIIH